MHHDCRWMFGRVGGLQSPCPTWLLASPTKYLAGYDVMCHTIMHNMSDLKLTTVTMQLSLEGCILLFYVQSIIIIFSLVTLYILPCQQSCYCLYPSAFWIATDLKKIFCIYLLRYNTTNLVG